MSHAISELLEPLIVQKRVISIAGASGTGKTTLALSLVGTLLSRSQHQQKHAIWVQASEAFPRRRLETMYASDPQRLFSISERLYIIPSLKPCGSYQEQNNIITQITKGQIVFPPDVIFLVIDNISHHLRYQISQYGEIKKTVNGLNHFFNAYLLPLILFCIHENIWLMFIHEATVDVARGLVRPFFYKTYERIDAVHITLHKEISRNIMEIKMNDTVFNTKYMLTNCGFLVQE